MFAFCELALPRYMLLTIYRFTWILCLLSRLIWKALFSMHSYILPEMWDRGLLGSFVHATLCIHPYNTNTLPHIPTIFSQLKSTTWDFFFNQEISYKIFLKSRLIRDLPESYLKCSLDTYSVLKGIFLKKIVHKLLSKVFYPCLNI